MKKKGFPWRGRSRWWVNHNADFACLPCTILGSGPAPRMPTGRQARSGQGPDRQGMQIAE